jgi:hypothetical protein
MLESGPLPAEATVITSWTPTIGRISTVGRPSIAFPAATNPLSPGATRIRHTFRTIAIGRGSAYVVWLHYGALPSPLQNYPGVLPRMVQAPPEKQPVTGDFDHLPYADPGFPGRDEPLSPASDQNDANAGGDAGNTRETALPIPLGFGLPNGVALGTRGVFVNSRVGVGNRADRTAQPDPADWFRFTVRPGAQVVVSVWPTRYDSYGGGITFEFWGIPADAAGLPPNADPVLLATGTDFNPVEQVFSIVDADPLIGYVPFNAPPRTFYLHVNSDGFVRYTIAVDYLGDLVPPGVRYSPCSGPLTSSCGGRPPIH